MLVRKRAVSKTLGLAGGSAPVAALCYCISTSNRHNCWIVRNHFGLQQDGRLTEKSFRADGLASATDSLLLLLLEVFLSSEPPPTRLTGMTTDDDGDLEAPPPVLDLTGESDDVIDDVIDSWLSSPASNRSLAICAQHQQPQLDLTAYKLLLCAHLHRYMWQCDYRH